jgi:hypothetical protein
VRAGTLFAAISGLLVGVYASLWVMALIVGWVAELLDWFFV